MDKLLLSLSGIFFSSSRVSLEIGIRCKIKKKNANTITTKIMVLNPGLTQSTLSPHRLTEKDSSGGGVGLTPIDSILN